MGVGPGVGVIGAGATGGAGGVIAVTGATGADFLSFHSFFLPTLVHTRVFAPTLARLPTFGHFFPAFAAALNWGASDAACAVGAATSAAIIVRMTPIVIVTIRARGHLENIPFQSASKPPDLCGETEWVTSPPESHSP